MTQTIRSLLVSIAAAGAAATLAVGTPVAARQDGLDLSAVSLPAGFHISVYADHVDGAREMTLGPSGVVFVGSRTPGRVYALVDRDGDHTVDDVKVVASGLREPNGVAFRAGSLYVATPSSILRYDDIGARLDNPPAPVTVRDNLPTPGVNHYWKFIAFGPDGKLYIPAGAPCNICEPPPMSGTILRMNPDGSDLEVFAKGVRNSVGFDWNPATHELWFSDNGRDMLGNDVPSDELNVAWKPGLNFGYPYCHQGDVADPEFGSKMPCSETEPPALKVGPHVASIGMRFYTGSMFPASYRNAIIVAQHGSWNREIPIGYRVMVVHVDGRRVTGYEPLVDGFLPGVRFSAPNGRGTGAPAMARPVDVLVMPDGSVLISDDSGNRVFRVTYGS